MADREHLHADGDCNLKNLPNKEVKLLAIGEEQWGLQDSLRSTGTIIITNEGNHHDIYAAGEYIAGGWGFDSYSYLFNVSQLAGKNATDALTYLVENTDTLSEVIANYSASTIEIDDDPNDDRTSFITVGNTTYNAPGVLFTIKADTVLSDPHYYLAQGTYVNNDPIVIECGKELQVAQISTKIESTKDLEIFDVIFKSQWTGSVSSMREYSRYTVNDISKEGNLLLLQNNALSKINDRRTRPTNDTIMIVYKDVNGSVKTLDVADVCWQLPIFYGTTEPSSTSFADFTPHYRIDSSLNTIPEMDITFTFNGDSTLDAKYGYIAIPTSWGEPRFILKNSNIKHKWKKTRTTVSVYTILGDGNNYYIYRTPVDYYGETSITWTLTK
jgi:hypothetical protein